MAQFDISWQMLLNFSELSLFNHPAFVSLPAYFTPPLHHTNNLPQYFAHVPFCTDAPLHNLPWVSSEGTGTLAEGSAVLQH